MHKIPLQTWCLYAFILTIHLSLDVFATIECARHLELLAESEARSIQPLGSSVPDASGNKNVRKENSKFFIEAYREDEGFLVGAKNISKKLSELNSLAGLSRTELDSSRPHNEDVTYRGFQTLISPWTTVRKTLLADNETILKAGLTHQDVADPLLLAMTKVESHFNKMGGFPLSLEKYYNEVLFGQGDWFQGQRPNSKTKWEPVEGIPFEYAGRKYLVRARLMPQSAYVLTLRGNAKPLSSGELYSDSYKPFSYMGSIPIAIQVGKNKLIGANYDIHLTSSEDGSVLHGDAITPHLIYRYGFYQSGEYRWDPTSIVHFFSLKGASGTK